MIALVIGKTVGIAARLRIHARTGADQPYCHGIGTRRPLPCAAAAFNKFQFILPFPLIAFRLYFDHRRYQ